MASRRDFLNLVKVNFFLSVFSITTAFKLKVFFSNDKKWLDRFECRSKIFPEKIYSSTNEFWADHQNPLGDNFYRFYFDKGFLVSIDSKVLADGKTVLVEKVYLSEFYRKIFYSDWKKLTSNYTYVENIDISNYEGRHIA
jgi:hypothetical protein